MRGRPVVGAVDRRSYDVRPRSSGWTSHTTQMTPSSLVNWRLATEGKAETEGRAEFSGTTPAVQYLFPLLSPVAGPAVLIFVERTSARAIASGPTAAGDHRARAPRVPDRRLRTLPAG